MNIDGKENDPHFYRIQDNLGIVFLFFHSARNSLNKEVAKIVSPAPKFPVAPYFPKKL